MHVIKTALAEGRTILSEHESKEVLRAYAIPVTREKEAYDERGFRKALAEIKFPLVIKGCGPKISHKTERGLVRINVHTPQEAMAAFKEIINEVKAAGGSVLVQEMILGSREMVAGLIRDLQFGPCVMFGLGGVFAEVLRDIVFRLAPIEKAEALDMIGEIKAKRILEAFRGMPAADIDRLADIVIKVGNIGLEQASIKEIDINPIILSENGPVAVDALIVLNR
jgi:acyl-CoA synthetase (NDP forming)